MGDKRTGESEHGADTLLASPKASGGGGERRGKRRERGRERRKKGTRRRGGEEEAWTQLHFCLLYFLPSQISIPTSGSQPPLWE